MPWPPLVLCCTTENIVTYALCLVQSLKRMILVGNVPDMSQTCTRDGDMSKIPGTESVGRPHFGQNFFSHVSNTLKKQRKREWKWTKSFKFAFRRLIQFHWKLFSEILLLQLQNNYWFQNRKMEVSTKDLLCEHKKCIMKQLSSVSPLGCLLFQDKIHFFSLFHFLTQFCFNLKFLLVLTK